MPYVRDFFASVSHDWGWKDISRMPLIPRFPENHIATRYVSATVTIAAGYRCWCVYPIATVARVYSGNYQHHRSNDQAPQTSVGCRGGPSDGSGEISGTGIVSRHHQLRGD